MKPHPPTHGYEKPTRKPHTTYRPTHTISLVTTRKPHSSTSGYESATTAKPHTTSHGYVDSGSNGYKGMDDNEDDLWYEDYLANEGSDSKVNNESPKYAKPISHSEGSDSKVNHESPKAKPMSHSTKDDAVTGYFSKAPITWHEEPSKATSATSGYK